MSDSHIGLGELVGLLMRAKDAPDIREKAQLYTEFAHNYDPRCHTINEEGLATASKDITGVIAAAYIRDIRSKDNEELRTKIINNADDRDITSHLRAFLADRRKSDSTYLHLAHLFNTAIRATNAKSEDSDKKIQTISYKSIQDAVAEAARQYLLNVVTENMTLGEVGTGTIARSMLLGGEIIFEFHNINDPVIEQSLEKVLRFVQGQEYDGHCVQRNKEQTSIDYNATKKVVTVSIAAYKLRWLKDILLQRGYSVSQQLQQRIDQTQERFDTKYQQEKGAVVGVINSLVNNMILAGFDNRQEELQQYGRALVGHLNGLKRKDDSECQLCLDNELERFYLVGQVAAGISQNLESRTIVNVRNGPGQYKIELSGTLAGQRELVEAICKEAVDIAVQTGLEIDERSAFANPMLGLVGQISRQQDYVEAPKKSEKRRIATYVTAAGLAALAGAVIAHNHYAVERLDTAEAALCSPQRTLEVVELGKGIEPDIYQTYFKGGVVYVQFGKTAERNHRTGTKEITYSGGTMQVSKAGWQFFGHKRDLSKALADKTCLGIVNQKINTAQDLYRGQVK